MCGEDEDDDDDAEDGRKVGRSTRDISDLPRSVGRLSPSRIILFRLWPETRVLHDTVECLAVG